MEAQFWIDHVAAIEREGCSARAYAKQHSISLSAVYYWQRKLRAAAPGEHVTANSGGRFMALRVAGVTNTPRSTGCTLILASGLSLEMAELPAPEWLAALGHAARGVR